MQRRDERRDDADTGRAEARADLEHEERGDDRYDRLRDAHRQPRPAERQVEAGEEPAVERLRVGGRNAGEEAEGAVVDERGRETVALVDELLEDRVALAQEHGEPREGGREGDDGDRASAAHQESAVASTSMRGTSAERYAVVSCHVERPLDDDVWARFSALQRRRPGGFAIAALMRPPDAAAGEDEGVWLERAREAATRGPLGHHTHWTAPDHARPTRDAASGEESQVSNWDKAGARVRLEGAWFRDVGLAPTLFCGGGWYTDADVADACAELGYVDCTPRASRPPYLASGEPWAALSSPARIRTRSGELLYAVPTTHSLGDLARASRPGRLGRLTHVYFHDTDLLSRRRTALLCVSSSRFSPGGRVRAISTATQRASTMRPRRRGPT